MATEASDYFGLLLGEARLVSQKTLERLKALHDRYPDDLPAEVIEVLRQISAKYPCEEPLPPVTE
jgi:hypothetical protein